MIIAAVDPGPSQSAVIVYSPDTEKIIFSGILGNFQLISYISIRTSIFDFVIIEQIESFGMPVGRSVFGTVFFTGRLYERLLVKGYVANQIVMMPRREVKLNLCNSMRAKDANIRQAILDRFPASGGGATPQVGTKKQPGPLYGIKSHIWSALALALTYADKLVQNK